MEGKAEEILKYIDDEQVNHPQPPKSKSKKGKPDFKFPEKEETTPWWRPLLTSAIESSKGSSSSTGLKRRCIDISDSQDCTLLPTQDKPAAPVYKRSRSWTFRKPGSQTFENSEDSYLDSLGSQQVHENSVKQSLPNSPSHHSTSMMSLVSINEQEDPEPLTSLPSSLHGKPSEPLTSLPSSSDGKLSSPAEEHGNFAVSRPWFLTQAGLSCTDWTQQQASRKRFAGHIENTKIYIYILNK
jgi:hypothetical protein